MKFSIKIVQITFNRIHFILWWFCLNNEKQKSNRSKEVTYGKGGKIADVYFWEEFKFVYIKI